MCPTQTKHHTSRTLILSSVENDTSQCRQKMSCISRRQPIRCRWSSPHLDFQIDQRPRREERAKAGSEVSPETVPQRPMSHTSHCFGQQRSAASGLASDLRASPSAGVQVESSPTIDLDAEAYHGARCRRQPRRHDAELVVDKNSRRTETKKTTTTNKERKKKQRQHYASNNAPCFG